MGWYEIRLKNFSWPGHMQLGDLQMEGRRLSCCCEEDQQAVVRFNTLLDLMEFYGEQGILLEESSAQGFNQDAIVRQSLIDSRVPLEYTLGALELFLKHAYTRYRDQTYCQKTGVYWGLVYYLSALSLPLFQTRFLSLFAAFELILAHVTPPAADGPLAGLIFAVKSIPSIPSKTRDVAAARLAAPNLAERMIEFVRLSGIKGVTFQPGHEELYRFDELLRLKEEFSKKGYSPRYGLNSGQLHRYGEQLKSLVRKSIILLLTEL